MHVTAHLGLCHHGCRGVSSVPLVRSAPAQSHLAASTALHRDPAGFFRRMPHPAEPPERSRTSGRGACVHRTGPATVYFWNCAHGIKLFTQKLGLDKAAKPFYRLQLDKNGLAIWMAGEQDKAAPSRQCDWHHIHLAYRTADAIYLYVQQSQAYLWNSSLDTAWDVLQQYLPADRLRDLRH